MLTCYVTGQVTTTDDVRTVRGVLSQHGITMTGGDRPSSPAAADAALRAAASADLLVLLPGNDVPGALVEVGAALSAGVPVVVVGPHPPGQRSPFLELPNVALLNNVDAFDHWLTTTTLAPALGRDPLTGHARWAETAIPQDAASQVAKVAEEFGEFLDDPCLEEAADVALVLAYWAHLRGENLTNAARRKALVNRDRIWVQLPDGRFRHTDHVQEAS